MQAAFDKAELRSALKAVTNVVERKANIPALHHVLVSVEEGGAVTLRGSNLDIGISKTITGGGEEPGETLLPARQLSAIVEHLPNEVVSLRHQEDASQATLSAGQAWFQLYTLDASEYPKPEELTEAQSFQCNTDVIKDAVARVRDAASHDDTQHVLSGVLLHFQQGDCRAVATDGRRCAIAGIRLNGDAPDCDAILPERASREILRAVPGDTDGTVYIDGTYVRIVTENLQIDCRQIEGSYPNYRQIIPENTPYAISAPRSSLLEAVERVALATDDGATGVTIEIQNDRTDLVANSQVGNAREHLADVSHNLDTDARLVLNPDFFRDGLKNLPGDYAYINFQSTSTPAVFNDSENSDYTYILMPMREG